jgi:hypothetical protein
MAEQRSGAGDLYRELFRLDLGRPHATVNCTTTIQAGYSDVPICGTGPGSPGGRHTAMPSFPQILLAIDEHSRIPKDVTSNSAERCDHASVVSASEECSFEPVKGGRNEIIRRVNTNDVAGLLGVGLCPDHPHPRHQRRRSSGTARQLSRGTPSQKNLGAMYVEPRDVS